VLGKFRSSRPSATIAAITLFFAATTIALTAAAAPDCPWVGSTAPVETRVAQVMEQMTSGEKLTMVHGALHAPTGIVGPIYAGLVPANPRLCIPQLGLLDGPAGSGDGLTGVTQLPAPIALAAGWDPDVAHAFGSVIASEHAGKGANVVCLPGAPYCTEGDYPRRPDCRASSPRLLCDRGYRAVCGWPMDRPLSGSKNCR